MTFPTEKPNSLPVSYAERHATLYPEVVLGVTLVHSAAVEGWFALPALQHNRLSRTLAH